MRRSNHSSRPISDNLASTRRRIAGLESDLREARHKEAQLLSEIGKLREAVDVHEQWRQLISHELHDGPAQQIAGAILQLQQWRARDTEDGSGQSHLVLAGCSLLEKANRELRQMMHGLQSSADHPDDLVAALRTITASGMDDVRVDLRADISQLSLASNVEWAVLRIVHEAVANARRHSGTDRIEVALTLRQNHLVVRIEDWGMGFRLRDVRHGRFGIEGMRRRAELLGGSLHLGSRPGKGTRIVAELPLRQQITVQVETDSGNT